MKVLNDEEIDTIQLKVMQGYIDIPTQRGYCRAVALVQYKKDIKDFLEFVDWLDNGLRSCASWRHEVRIFAKSLKQLVEE